MTRGKFGKSPGLNKKTFDKKRKLINNQLRKKFDRQFVTNRIIHYYECGIVKFHRGDKIHCLGRGFAES
uniref:Uncharacterized protein n=1 Tax=Magallana gigas TaxID=29159 RepID=K1QKH6_MAGGI